MAYSYKSSISFGLVYIPVTLHLCVKNNDISFNLIDKNTMSRIKYLKTCLDCEGREVKQSDIIKGYEYEEGNFVLIDENDFEKIKSKRDKTIAIERFVNLNLIDPVYYDKAFYVMPSGAEQAYALLLGAMEAKNMAGIAKSVLGNKETLIVLRVREGKMLLNTLFFSEEIQDSPAKNISPVTSGKELELAINLIENMSGGFEPESYKDEYRDKLIALIDSKISGRALDIPKEKGEQKAGSLMDALIKSIESARGQSDKPTKSAKPKTPADKDRKTGAPKPVKKTSGQKSAAVKG